MRFDELLPGTRLELETLNDQGEKVGSTYVSQLLEPAENMGMLISTPIFESRLVYIHLGSRLRLTFFHRKYGLMGFIAVLEARDNRDNLSVLKIKALSGLEKIQRRKHYRLDCLQDAGFRILSSPQEASDKTSLIKATVKNISGSGACIFTNENVPEKAILTLHAHLGPEIEINALCIVIRSQMVQVKKGTSYELGLHFTDISDKDQDLIIKYIFEQQRVLLKRDILDK